MVSSYSDVIEKIFFEINEIIFNSNLSESMYKGIIEMTYNEFKMKENAIAYEKAFIMFNKLIQKNVTHYSENLKVNKLII